MKVYRLGVLGLCLLLPAAALADFQYQETSQITGGSLLSMMKMMGHFSRSARQVGEPIVATVYVQGNRMARIDPNEIQIIDLDKGTITNVDLKKHTYTEMTFKQMRQQMEMAAEKIKAQQAKAQSNAPSPQQPPSNVDLKFIVNVRNTGTTKQVSGLNASESILTMQMQGTDKTNGQKAAFAITNDMWLAPDIPGYNELRAFQQKLAVKMGSAFTGSGLSATMAAMQPGMGQGMSDMVKEVSKLNGFPVQQIMRMGATANGDPLPAASEAPLPDTSSGPPPPSAGDVAKQSASSAIASKLGGLSGFGGFGGFGHKKKTAPPPEESADAQGNSSQQGPVVLMEMQTQWASFSSAPIDPAKFSVPAGFTPAAPQLAK